MSWKTHASLVQNSLQSYINENSVQLAHCFHPIGRHHPIGRQKREPRKKLFDVVNDFKQGCQDHSMGKGQLCQQVWLGSLDMYIKRMQLDPYLTLHTKYNLKCIKDIHVPTKTIKS